MSSTASQLDECLVLVRAVLQSEPDLIIGSLTSLGPACWERWLSIGLEARAISQDWGRRSGSGLPPLDLEPVRSVTVSEATAALATSIVGPVGGNTDGCAAGPSDAATQHAHCPQESSSQPVADTGLARVRASPSQSGTIHGRPGHFVPDSERAARAASRRCRVSSSVRQQPPASARSVSRRPSRPSPDLVDAPYDVERWGHVKFFMGGYTALHSAVGDEGDLPPSYRQFFRPLHPRRERRLPKSLRNYGHTLDGFCLHLCSACSEYSCSRVVSFSHNRGHSGHYCPGCH